MPDESKFMTNETAIKITTILAIVGGILSVPTTFILVGSDVANKTPPEWSKWTSGITLILLITAIAIGFKWGLKKYA